MNDSGALRVDVLLHRLCITKSRNEAKGACDAGAILVNGSGARASREVNAGDRVEVRFPRRTLEIEIVTLPPKSTSRKAARDMYRVLQDDPAADRI